MELDDKGSDVAFQGQEELTRRCMAESGLDYVKEPTPPQREEMDDIYPTPQELAEHGYQWSIARLQEQNSAASKNPNPIDNQAYIEVLDTCRTAAVRSIGAVEFGERRAVIERAANEIMAAVDSDPRSIDVTERWSECMKTRGYKFDTPGEAMEASDPDERNGAEIAVVDYECRRDVKRTEVRHQIRSELQRAWLDEHPEEVAALTAAREELIDRASGVLAEE